MIMIWKPNGNDYVARWNGTNFRLTKRTDARWHLLADDKHVKQNWGTSRAAMDGIDAMQNKLIMEAASQPKLLPYQQAAIEAVLKNGDRVTIMGVGVARA